MTRAGLIADLENEIARVQKLIEKEIDRIKKCPKDESLENCNKIATSGESHELQFENNQVSLIQVKQNVLLI